MGLATPRRSKSNWQSSFPSLWSLDVLLTTPHNMHKTQTHNHFSHHLYIKLKSCPSVCLSVCLTVYSARIPFEFTHFSCQLLHVSERFLCPRKRSSSVSNIVFSKFLTAVVRRLQRNQCKGVEQNSLEFFLQTASKHLCYSTSDGFYK